MAGAIVASSVPTECPIGVVCVYCLKSASKGPEEEPGLRVHLTDMCVKMPPPARKPFGQKWPISCPKTSLQLCIPSSVSPTGANFFPSIG